MRFITSIILFLLLLTISPSSFSQEIEEMMEADTMGISQDQIPADLSFGNESDSNFVKFVTPSGSITIYFPEVLMVDEGEGYSVHFPPFGLAPIIPDYLDITAKEVFREWADDELESKLMNLSLSFNEQGDYSFLRDYFNLSLFECNKDFSRNYRLGIISQDISNMTHSLDKSGSKYVLDYKSTYRDDDTYQLLIHVEAKPSQLIAKKEDTIKPNRVYYFPDLGLLSYQEGSYSYFGPEDFIPLPEKGDMRSGNFDPESYLIYEFESLSEKDIFFNVYSIKSWEGDDKYDQTIHAPLEDSDPDIRTMALTGEMLKKNVEATTIYTIKGPAVILNYEDLDEDVRACIYPYEYQPERPIIGSKDLPSSQSLAVNPNNFRSFKLINNKLEGLTFNFEGNTITQKKANISALVATAKYKEVIDKVGKNAQNLFYFTYYIITNWKDVQKKPLDWWEGKAKEFKVKNLDADTPQAYAEGIMKYYFGEDDDLVEMIIFMKSDQKQVTLETVEQLASSKNQYSDRFWVDLIINQQGTLVNATHHRPGNNGDITLSFNYQVDQMVVKLVDEKNESFHRELSGMEGLIDYNFVLAALPAMKLKSGYQNALYITNYEARRFGGDHLIKPVFNKVDIIETGEETINFLNQQVETFKVELRFMDLPDNPTVSTIYGEMIKYEEKNDYYLNVWISKKDNLPIRVQTGRGSYWLFKDGDDVMQFHQWLENDSPDPFGLY